MATQFGALNIVFYLTLFLQQLISDAAWCRSFDHKPGPNSRGTLFPTRLHLLLGALLILYFIMPAGYRGEGSVFAMEHREALNSLLHNMHPLSAKQHGLGHSAGMCLPETKKRSFRRACRRAMINGCSWYHGKCWTTSDFPPALCTSVAASFPSTSHHSSSFRTTPSTNQAHSPKRRLKLFQWNPGGLSSDRFAEFQLWLQQQAFDVVCLSETRWKVESEWVSKHWTCIHTGTDAGHDGVLLMISNRLCSSMKVSWQTVLAGRLLHVRLHLGLRNYDIVGVYQWPHNAHHKTARQRLVDHLDQLMHRLPRRNLLALMGDFNTSSMHLVALQAHPSTPGNTLHCRDHNTLIQGPWSNCFNSMNFVLSMLGIRKMDPLSLDIMAPHASTLSFVDNVKQMDSPNIRLS